MKKRIKNDRFMITVNKVATPEVKVRTKNRYPVDVPTPAQLFSKDIEWKKKANPNACKLEDSFK